MLTHLQIRDFAIIDVIELEVRAGLTVLSGETGAGKSIIVDALALLAGGKGGAEVVRANTERAELSATFDIRKATQPLRELLAEQSIDAGDELTVRRVISNDGRSRGYLNGVSVPVTLLRDVGGLIIDIHGQHEFQSLGRVSAQRELLDEFGKHVELADGVRDAYKNWVGYVNRASELEGKTRDRDSQIERLRHEVSELKALDLKEGEVAQLTEERTRHSNRGRLAEAAQVAVGLLYDSDEGNAHATASRALAGIKTLSSVDQRLAKVIPLVDEATIQIREAARELSRYLETLDIDPARQELVERRLAAIEELSRKHRVQTAELAGRLHLLEKQLADLDSADNDLNALKKQQAEALEVYRKLASQLSASRQTAARALSKDITARMQTLGMAGGGFLIDVNPANEPAAHGFDAIEFRVKTNPGQPPRPLAKVASGGELSRLSLAVQVACSAKDARCMVFDEVDSGVGGAVAEIVGRELKAIGYSGQALCVTHLPQVASQGHHQLRVTKLTDGKTTRTTITDLTYDERIEEIARMLGGKEITGKAREHAREMLQMAGSPDQKARSGAGSKRKA
jgi:DNA repair protein RecN (Recombination protein N)